jgi:hypothetical protein
MSTSVPVRRTAAPAAEVKRDAVPLDSRRQSSAVVPAVDTINRPIEPMLLVHEERMKTFRLLASFVGRALRAIAARFTVD